MPTLGWILLVIVAVVVLGIVGLVVAPYNRLVRLRNTLQESWRQVDVELNRRYDLVPNLVETVRGYAEHERSTLEEIVRLRNQATALAPATASDDPAASTQRAQVESQLGQQLGRLMVTVEAYPQLQSNANFVELQRQLADTEDRIAAGRRFYNANVRAYNIAVESMPGNLVANAFHFQKASYFELTDEAARQAPTVSFGDAGRSSGAQAGGLDAAAPQVGSGQQDQLGTGVRFGDAGLGGSRADQQQLDAEQTMLRPRQD